MVESSVGRCGSCVEASGRVTESLALGLCSSCIRLDKILHHLAPKPWNPEPTAARHHPALYPSLDL